MWCVKTGARISEDETEDPTSMADQDDKELSGGNLYLYNHGVPFLYATHGVVSIVF